MSTSDYPDLQLYVDGSWRTADDELPVVDPATEEVIGQVPVAGPGDLDDAVKAAVRGFEAWRLTPPSDRAEVICRAAGLMRERQEEIARSITLEHGKP
ncbi:MAG: aldehyde dehydrogenase family protein, partial [Actinomycetota bacterium]|nr:aldehyde dehydrogenase family protein [Actinomycetota bacterium]